MVRKAIAFGVWTGFSAFIFFIPCTGQDKAWKGSIHKEGGVTILENPKTPLYSPDVFELQEEYIIKSEGRGYQFVNPAELLLDDDKNLYVMDIRDDNIKVFDESGRYSRTIGRRGAGPGEFEGLGGMAFFKNQLVVHCFQLARLTYLDPQGKVIRTQAVFQDLARMTIDSKGNFFGIDSSHETMNGVWEIYWELRKYAAGLKILKTIAPRVKQPRLGFYQGGAQCFAVTADDRIIYGLSFGYELKVFDNDGTLLMAIRKKHEPIPFPPENVDHLKKILKKGVPEGWDTTIPEYFAPFYGITTDEEGRIFVQTTANVSNLNDYDVFSPEGHFLATIKARSWRDPYWKNRRLYAIDEDEDGYRFIRVARVTWKY